MRLTMRPALDRGTLPDLLRPTIDMAVARAVQELPGTIQQSLGERTDNEVARPPIAPTKKGRALSSPFVDDFCLPAEGYFFSGQ